MEVHVRSDDQRFDIRGALGAGGMGTVYRAFDRRAGREVALKMLREVTGRDLYRFKREFRLVADMAHPNLATLHELHTTGGDWYFTMELVDGVPFLDWVRPTGALDLARLRAALPQLVEGVLALHVAGTLHRDLKPSNVLVTREGRVVLLDFGLASAVDTMHVERTHEAAAVGTPAYMSPEQAADVALTEASDWYSVGVMVYEALTGRRPFDGSSDEQMRRKQIERPAAPRVRVPGLPADLDELGMALLEAEPQRRPDGRAVLAALGAEPSPALATVEHMVAARPFVGRHDELVALHRAFVDAHACTVGVFVRGESGIGKSQLVRRFLDDIGGQAIVIESRCYERESVPYKALDPLVDDLTAILLGLSPARLEAVLPRGVAALARLFPVLRRVPTIATRSVAAVLPSAPLELRTHAFNALRELLDRLADTAPLVIAIDDLQWGDTDSAIFVADLLRAAEPLPLLLLLIHRPEDDAGVVARVRAPRAGLGDGDLRTVEVGPLPEDDARQLLRAVGAGDTTGDTLLRGAGGHPLFLAELARTAHRPGPAPTSVDELIAERIAGLPGQAAALLRTSAVAARPLPLDLAARAAAIELDGSEVPLLRAERLLRARHADAEIERVEPYHDRVREAAIKVLAPDALRAVHRGLALAYEVSGRAQDREALVGHWVAAGEPARAASHATAAAQIAEETLAFHRAAALYTLALEHGTAEGAALRTLHRKHGDALANAGRLVEAAAAFAEASVGADPDEAVELGRLRLAQLLRRTLLAEGRELSRRMLAPLGIAFPTTRAASIRAVLFQLIRNRLRGLDFVERAEADVAPEVLRAIDLLSTTATALGIADPIIGRVVQSHCLRTALDAGEPHRICMALAIDLGYRAQKGTYGQRHIQEALTRVRDLTGRVDGRARAIGTVMQGFLDFQLGRHKEARPMIEAGLTMLRENVTGLRWEVTVNEQVLVSILYYLGEVGEVCKLVPRLLREAIDRGDLYAQDGMRGWRGNVAWLFMGKSEEARAHVRSVEGAAPTPDTVAIRHVNELVSHLQGELYDGNIDAAKARLDATWPILAASFLLRVQLVRIEAHLARGRVLAAYAMMRDGDDRKRALAELRRTIKELSIDRAPWGLAFAAMFRGLASRAVGDLRGAAIELDEAERALASVDLRLFAEAVRLRRGQLEGGTAGDTRAAAALASMREQGIADPLAIARMLCPWPA